MTKRAAPIITGGVIVVVAVMAGGWLVARPGASVASIANERVTIECTGATGVSEDACRGWGDAVLGEDAPPRTFEREDLRRVRLDRALFGLGDECRTEWFVSRYPDRPVWSGAVECP